MRTWKTRGTTKKQHNSKMKYPCLSVGQRKEISVGENRKEGTKRVTVRSN